MARRRDIPANATRAEIDAAARKIVAGVRASLEKAAPKHVVEPPKITPRPALTRFSPENVERLLRVIESGPTEDQFRAFERRAGDIGGRRYGVGPHAQRALKKCIEHYAGQYPNSDTDSLPEIAAIRRFIRQQRDDLAADIRNIKRKLNHLRAIGAARDELQAIKDDFNKLGNDNKSTTP